MKKIIFTGVFLISVFSVLSAQTIIDSTGFNSSLFSNSAELLRGKISGVRVSAMDGNPIGASNVNIRGINSLRSDNQPLWIIDGIPVSLDINHNLDAFWQYGEQSFTAPLNPLSFLDPNEIQSIEVIKNSSATAIYGSRGANGVILVSTKKGSSRERVIDLTSNVGVNFDNIQSVPTVSNNHRIAFAGSGQNGATGYNISAAFRETCGTVGNNRGDNFSLKANYFTTAHKVVHFGFDSIVSIGKTRMNTGTSYLGAPSLTLALRDPALSKNVTANDWLADYDDDATDYRALASAWVKFNITKSLSIKVDAAVDFQNNNRLIWYGKRTDFGAVSEDNIGGGAAALLESMLLGYNTSARLEYKTYFAKDHHFDAFLDFNLYGMRQRFNTMNGRNFSVHNLRAKGISSKGTATENRLFLPEYFHLGGAAFIGYDWKGAAGINASINIDNTPKYSANTMRFYPSAEVFFDFHKIFFPSFDAVSELKISGGWGRSGREQYVPYEQFDAFLSSGWPQPAPWTEFFYDGLNLLTTDEMHLTADLGFIRDRLKASFTYYDRKTADGFTMYCMAGDPVQNGSKTYYHWVDPSVIMERSSSVANRGFELDLDALCIKRGSFDWFVSAGAAYNVNQVISAAKEDFAGRAVGQNIYCTCNSLGLPVSSLYGYYEDMNGNYKDVTGEGLVTDADKIILGNSIPKFTAYLGSTLRYKGLSFNFQMDGAADYQIADINSLVKDGKIDSEGKIALSSSYVKDADYFRLSVVGISYSVPLRVKWLSDLTFRLCAKNLVSFSKYKGWNPDVNSFGVSPLSSGLDYGSYPVQRSVMFGFSVKF